MIADMPIFTVNYLQYAGKARQDVNVVYNSYLPWRLEEYESKYPALFPKGLYSSTTDCLLKNSAKLPVYTEGVHSGLEDFVTPIGLACKLSLNDNFKIKATNVKNTVYLYNLYRFRKSKDTLDYYEKQVISYYTSACFNASVILKEGGLIKESDKVLEQSNKFND